jgi:hypothetical protein
MPKTTRPARRTLDRIHHALYVECRERGEREASPTAAIIDSQSVKSAEKGGAGSIRMAVMRARNQGQEAPWLPWLLAKVAEHILPAMQKQATLLLENR